LLTPRFTIAAMHGRLPLPTLLSHALTAFTIEFDNEFEHRMPHRTTNHGSAAGSRHAPWLVSMAMWSNFMQFVGEEGVTVRELQRLLRIADTGMRTWLTRMGEWWGYVSVESDGADSRSKRIHPNAMVRPTPAGRKAQAVWRPLAGVIENRWQQRFGKDELAQLRQSLAVVAGQIDVELPGALPILGYGLFSGAPDQERRAASAAAVAAIPGLPLPSLLSMVLLAFAIEFERDTEVSLAIGANVLRLVGEKGVRVRDLPRLAAVSKEAIAMALGFLRKRGYAVLESESSGTRVKVLVLTAKGQRARNAYRELVWAIEDRWQARFGNDNIRTLRELLERLAGEPTAQLSPLFRGLEPYPDGWRASVPRPEGLPHYPMVLHRGGFPDGS
jgi:DNA-binding MarR family transcriptional regulator